MFYDPMIMRQNIILFFKLVYVNKFNLDWLIDWLVFNVQRAIFQLYSGREHFKNLNATGLETRKGDG